MARAVSAARFGWIFGPGSRSRHGSRTRVSLPVGALVCVINGPTCERPWSTAATRTTLRYLAVNAGIRHRFAPHQLRHAHAVEMAREDVPLNVIQRQLGNANLGITSVYLQGIDDSELIDTVPPPSGPGTAGRRRCAGAAPRESSAPSSSRSLPWKTGSSRSAARAPTVLVAPCDRAAWGVRAAPRASQAFAETTNGGSGSLSLQSSRNAARRSVSRPATCAPTGRRRA